MIRCLPTDKEPTHLLSLTGYTADGEEITIGFNPVDTKGKPSIHAIRYNGYPTGTLRTSGGEGEYSVLKPPYGQFSRRDWSGGIGLLNGDSDVTRYWFGKRVWSVVPERMMLAPRLFYSKSPYPQRYHNMDSRYYPIAWASMGVNDRLAWRINLPYDANEIDVLARFFEAGKIYFEIHTDNSGNIGSAVSVVTQDVYLGSHLYQFDVNLPQGTYWVIVYGDVPFEVATCNRMNLDVRFSTDNGITYNTTTIFPPVFMAISSTEASDWVFFRYRWGTYAVADKHLLLNGDRGACDSTTDKSIVLDATKNWTANQWAGAIVKLNAAPLGWRRVVGNTATSLTVDRQWKDQLSTDNWYVILGDEWTEITVNPAFTKDVTDAKALREDTVYFAMGVTTQLKAMRETNENGVWTRVFRDETVSGDLPGANFLVPVFDQVTGACIYRIVNGNGFIAKSPAVAWGTNLQWGTEIKIGNDNWEDLTGGCEYDGYLAVTAMDSVWLVKNDVPEKVSIDLENQWTMNTGRRPCVVPPYLVFPFGNRVERMYQNLVEDFGVERDHGVPARYDGLVMDCLSIVGGLIIVKDGGRKGEYAQDAEGGAFLYRNGGWHPLAFTGLNSGMKAAFYQRREDEMDYVWFGDRNGLWYMPVSRAWDYTKDAKFNPTNAIEHDGFFITGWFDTGRILPQKWWDFISVFASNLSAERKIKVYYQISNGEEYLDENLAADWTYAGETGGGYASHITLDVMGRRIRFLFLLIGDGDGTPILEGYTVNYISRDDDAEVWTIAFSMKDCGYDRAGTPREDQKSADLAEIINYWARTVRPLKMRCHFDLWDNREVVIERPGIVPLELTPEGRENHYAQMVIRGIEEPADDPLVDTVHCPEDSPETDPYLIEINQTLQPDKTASVIYPYTAIIRTPQHTNRTRYKLTGTWYKREDDQWVETSEDDFYEVRAYDEKGNVVAVGTKDPVTDNNIRTGYLEALSPKKIKAIGIHIIGQASFRPSSISGFGIALHPWFPVSTHVEWGYTDFGVWVRSTGWRTKQTDIGLGWGGTAGTEYLFGFWSGWDYISIDNGYSFPTTFKVRQIMSLGSFGTSKLTNATSKHKASTLWTTAILPNFTGGVLSFENEFDITCYDINSLLEIGAGFNATIYDGTDFDFAISHYLWVHYPPMVKIDLQDLEIENVC